MSTQFPPFPPWSEPAVTGLVGITDEPIDFTPIGVLSAHEWRRTA